MISGFFARLFYFFIGIKDPETAKKRRLKQLAKEISGNRYARFYKPRHEEATAALGQFFYDVYKTIAPAQVFLQNAAKSTLLKQIIAESFFDKELTEVKDRLSEESIGERVKTTALHVIIKALKDDIAYLSDAFDPIMKKRIDLCYVNILCMARFVTFDFFAFLKNFSASLVERDFSFQPVFSAVQGANISDELKEFLEVSFAVDPDQDWKHILWILKTYRNGAVIITDEQWEKLLSLLQDVRRTGILELMIRYIDKEPNWRFNPKLKSAQIAEKYLDSKQSEVRVLINKLAVTRKGAKRKALVSAVFGDSRVQRARFYTEAASLIYHQKNFDGFLYAAQINYLLNFLLDIFNGELHDLCDFLIIRGKWINPESSQDLTEHFYLLSGFPDALISFDEMFSKIGAYGSRLQTALSKVERDKQQIPFIITTLTGANEEALERINSGVRLIIELGKIFNSLLEDRQSNTHTLMRNWPELEEYSQISMAERLSGAYNKVLYFVQLMYFLTKSEDEQADMR